ncbi:MAG: hypothetical protein Q4G60_09800 [bacterium]|nr:hypothetical protein [bacterium]
MKGKDLWIELLMTFLIVTACVTILEGVLGVIFMPDTQLSFGAFFSPPLFGLLSALASLITVSKKELTIPQTIFRKILHLLMIEAMVFGINAAVGNFYEPKLCITLVLSIAVVYVTVNFVMFVSAQRSAVQFNQNLRLFQEQMLRQTNEEKKSSQ